MTTPVTIKADPKVMVWVKKLPISPTVAKSWQYPSAFSLTLFSGPHAS
jgi:hypothetical protein